MIYFAGAESGGLSDELEAAKVKNILYSFFWIVKKNAQTQFAERVMKGKEQGIKYLLDSGAFTYQTMAVSGELMPLKVYLEKYMRFVEKYGQLFEACAELDIEGAEIPGHGEVQIEEVWKWRTDLVKANPLAKIMPVWHVETRTKNEWAELCSDSRFPYLGIGGQAGQMGDSNIGVFSSLLAQAHAHGKIVHGFAATKVQTQLKKLKYDSADSASWLSAQKFGSTFIFRSGQWIVLDKTQKDKRRAFRQHFKAKGIDYEKLEADKSSELRHAAIIAWRDLGAELMKKRASLHKKLVDEGAEIQSALTKNALNKVMQEDAEELGAEAFVETPVEAGSTIRIPGPKTGHAKESPLLERVKRHLSEVRAITLQTDQQAQGNESQNESLSLQIQTQNTGANENQNARKNGDSGSTEETREREREGRIQGPSESSDRSTSQLPRSSVKAGSKAPIPALSMLENSQNDTSSGVSGDPAPGAVSSHSGAENAVSGVNSLENAVSVDPVAREQRFLTKLASGRSKLATLPGLRCGVCSIGSECPKYEETATSCALEDNFNAFPVRDADNILAGIETIVDINKSRLFKLYMMENLVEGGMPSEKATSMSEVVLGQLQMLREQRSLLEGKAVQVSTKPGVLSSIFGVGVKQTAQGTEIQIVSGRENTADPEKVDDGVQVLSRIPGRVAQLAHQHPMEKSNGQVLEQSTQNQDVLVVAGIEGQQGVRLPQEEVSTQNSMPSVQREIAQRKDAGST